MPTSFAALLAHTALATAAASACVRQPVRAPCTPISSITSKGTLAGLRFAQSSMSASCAVESTRNTTRRSACWASSIWMPARSSSLTTWLAINVRRAPAATPTASWVTVAKVSPHAPASSWRWNSCGDMVVLPCGARSMPHSRTRDCIHWRLCSSASRLSTASGSGRSPASTFQPAAPTSLRRRGGWVRG
ncbi:hypothetical protein D9M68_801850 [compost metagenome]